MHNEPAAAATSGSSSQHQEPAAFPSYAAMMRALARSFFIHTPQDLEILLTLESGSTDSLRKELFGETDSRLNTICVHQKQALQRIKKYNRDLNHVLSIKEIAYAEYCSAISTELNISLRMDKTRRDSLTTRASTFREFLRHVTRPDFYDSPFEYMLEAAESYLKEEKRKRLLALTSHLELRKWTERNEENRKREMDRLVEKVDADLKREVQFGQEALLRLVDMWKTKATATDEQEQATSAPRIFEEGRSWWKETGRKWREGGREVQADPAITTTKRARDDDDDRGPQPKRARTHSDANISAVAAGKRPMRDEMNDMDMEAEEIETLDQPAAEPEVGTSAGVGRKRARSDDDESEGEREPRWKKARTCCCAPLRWLKRLFRGKRQPIRARRRNAAIDQVEPEAYINNSPNTSTTPGNTARTPTTPSDTPRTAPHPAPVSHDSPQNPESASPASLLWSDKTSCLDFDPNGEPFKLRLKKRLRKMRFEEALAAAIAEEYLKELEDEVAAPLAEEQTQSAGASTSSSGAREASTVTPASSTNEEMIPRPWTPTTMDTTRSISPIYEHVTFPPAATVDPDALSQAGPSSTSTSRTTSDAHPSATSSTLYEREHVQRFVKTMWAPILTPMDYHTLRYEEALPLDSQGQELEQADSENGERIDADAAGDDESADTVLAKQTATTTTTTDSRPEESTRSATEAAGRPERE